MSRWYVLPINPEPWAIGPLSVGKKAGKVFPKIGRNAQLAAFQAAVRECMGDVTMLPEGEYALTFYLWRRRDEYVTPQARSHRKHEADTTNMQKALEDALQGVLFKNDKDVKDVRSILVEQGPDVQPCIVIRAGQYIPDDEEIPSFVREKVNVIQNLRHPLGDRQLELPVTDEDF